MLAYPVERIVEVPHEVLQERLVPVDVPYEVEVPYPVENIIERCIEKIVEVTGPHNDSCTSSNILSVFSFVVPSLAHSSFRFNHNGFHSVGLNRRRWVSDSFPRGGAHYYSLALSFPTLQPSHTHLEGRVGVVTGSSSTEVATP